MSRGMPMPAATLTRRMPHYRLSPPRRCRGLTASGTALRSICLSLGVVGRVAASGDAHAAHAALSPVPRRCRGLTASGTALRSICLFLGVVGRVAASGDAHAAHAALSPVPPTLSGVNCKRDRVAVDLSVSWRCWRACLCQRRRSRSASRRTSSSAS